MYAGWHCFQHVKVHLVILLVFIKQNLTIICSTADSLAIIRVMLEAFCNLVPILEQSLKCSENLLEHQKVTIRYGISIAGTFES